ncbi:hypothetical protein KIN20_008689 [Parelaphostrongylus tenuis]|uniref:TRAF-type domain-containing protein n=1 Tax=Parelaphostrongylus tenuis TaxID=148309 RepID=A0AAD5MQR6_PARTN|nr:hypothetical protein KIN20_008689 [Parelaphostrongylus tenuis]
MEELEWLNVCDIVHFTHCISCHLPKCDMESMIQCQIVQCPQCYVSMHECKIEDHITEICYKTFIPCINAAYGCRKLIRRDKRSKHLENCSASVVVCGREWDRCALSPTSKLQLKRWGKRIEAEYKRNSGNLPLDIALTISDQDLIIQSYGFSRLDRVRRRDGLHPSHPLLPLREIRDTDGLIMGTSKFSNDENSSDEEARIKEAKLKKKRAMFAHCYMCQIDPASQHLHTLGNESVKYVQTKRIKKHEKEVDSFHKLYNLQLNFSPETMPEFLVRGENISLIRSGGTLYTRRCLKTIRRSEYADHHLSLHVRCINSLSDLVVRCPNWERGCTFHTKRLRPKCGMIRFLSSLDSISFSSVLFQLQQRCINFTSIRHIPCLVDYSSTEVPT